ncbi:hypothetical protein ACOMHN_053932 [Nucella lapillus]
MLRTNTTKTKISTFRHPPQEEMSDQLEMDLLDEDDSDVSEEESVAPSQSQNAHKKKYKKVKTTPTNYTKKKGKTPKRLKFTQAEQGALRDWLYENPIIWDKGDADYKDNDKRDKVYRVKAASLDIDPKGLKTWYDGMRTRFAKAIEKKSGDKAKVLPPGEQWITGSFQFLLPHVHRMREITLGSLNLKAKGPRVAPLTSKATSPPTSDEEVEEEEDEDVAAHEFDNTDLEVVASTATAPPPPKKSKRQEAVRKLQERQRASAQLHQQVQQLIAAPPLGQKAAYGNWLAAVSREVHPSIWYQFHQWSSEGYRYFLQESERLNKQPFVTSTPAKPPATSGQEPPEQQQQFQHPPTPQQAGQLYQLQTPPPPSTPCQNYGNNSQDLSFGSVMTEALNLNSQNFAQLP